MARLLQADSKAAVTEIATRYSQLAEKHLTMHNTANLEADGLDLQKTMSGSADVSQNQKAEATVGTDSPITGQLKTRNMHPGLMNLDFS